MKTEHRIEPGMRVFATLNGVERTGVVLGGGRDDRTLQWDDDGELSYEWSDHLLIPFHGVPLAENNLKAVVRAQEERLTFGATREELMNALLDIFKAAHA